MNWRKVEVVEQGSFPNVQVSFFSLSCFHCQKPLCISVCPPEAIFKRDKDGLVLVEQDRCLGEASCGLCREACPFHIPQFNPQRGFRMEKCDFCAERLDQGKKPICVEACPMEALDVGPYEVLLEKNGHKIKMNRFPLSKETLPSILII
jgi:anaerobic dimethyl sulfoxide reductase subunit B (iron-sulfur subunit)